MYHFQNKETGENNLTPMDLRQRHAANVSFGPTVTPEVADALGYFTVYVDDKPVFDPIHEDLVALDPVDDSEGVRRQHWRVDAASFEQVSQRKTVQLAAVQATLEAAVQEKLDLFARTRNYDNIASAASYSGSKIAKFAAEGQYAIDARDSMWSALYVLMDAVAANTRQMPTGFSNIEASLPTLAWPG